MVNGSESFAPRKTDCEDAEVSLQSWIYGETSGSWVHAGDVLTVVDLLESESVPVIPGTTEIHVHKIYWQPSPNRTILIES